MLCLSLPCPLPFVCTLTCHGKALSFLPPKFRSQWKCTTPLGFTARSEVLNSFKCSLLPLGQNGNLYPKAGERWRYSPQGRNQFKLPWTWKHLTCQSVSRGCDLWLPTALAWLSYPCTSGSQSYHGDGTGNQPLLILPFSCLGVWLSLPVLSSNRWWMWIHLKDKVAVVSVYQAAFL